MKWIACLFCFIFFMSCEEKKEYKKLSDTSAFLVKIQLAQLDSTINRLKNESGSSEYFYEEIKVVNRKLDSLKLSLKQNNIIDEKIKNDLVKNYLEPNLFMTHLDSNQRTELQNLNLTSDKDIDLLAIYIKGLYVKWISSNVYNQFSTLATVTEPKIKVGDEFSMELGFAVRDSRFPPEFYIVNRDNEEIIEKVPNTESGPLYKTRNFKKGLNRIRYIAVYRDLRYNNKKDTVARVVEFYAE